MFTIKEIRELALRLESNGEALYREVAAKAVDPALKALMDEIAHDEARHAQWFTRLDGGFIEEDKATDGDLESMGLAMLAEMVDGQTFSLDADRLERADTVAEVISQAVELERDTIVFYEMLADFVQEDAAATYLERIIAEEHAHIEKLKAYLKINLESGSP